MQNLYSLLGFIISIFTLLSIIQPLPSFLLLLPIILLTASVGWYLHRIMQREHEEQMKRHVQYEIDEENAQNWLHQSFVPKTKIMLQKHIKQTIVSCGIILVLFIFFWSYLVAGFHNALLSVLVALLLYTAFTVYILHVDKWYKNIFKRVPKPYRHFKNNDWIHGYAILLPFSFTCFIIYVAFNYRDIVTIVLFIPSFVFVYTLLFIGLYCCYFVYKEYAKEESAKQQYVKKPTEE
jgi:hypothetical protein